MLFTKSAVAVALLSLAGFAAASPLQERAICNPPCADGEECVQAGEFPNIGVCRATTTKRGYCNPAAGGECPDGQTCTQQGEFPNIGYCS